jgi:hypothetical protein
MFCNRDNGVKAGQARDAATSQRRYRRRSLRIKSRFPPLARLVEYAPALVFFQRLSCGKTHCQRHSFGALEFLRSRAGASQN